jgi:zona occludens toxin (predicted ATPase)
VAASAPVAASEATPQLAQPTTLAASVSATVAAMPIPTSALAQATPAAQASATTDTGKSFFKTPAGRISLVLMLAGTSYMVYSAFKDNDPVHSQFR